MKIHYDPSLIEAVVVMAIKRREEAGDLHPLQQYHALTDPIYERVPLKAREAGFEKVHREFFLQLGFGEAPTEALEEFPGLEGKVEEVFIGKALSRQEEGADLGHDRTRIGVKVRPERFGDSQALRSYLRHELQHLADMLDPAFGYVREERLASSPAEENFIRERYRLIWAVFIDGRFARQGKETIATKGERFRDFETLCPKFPHPQRLVIFESLFGAERLTHAEILAMAKDPNCLLERVGEDSLGGLPQRVLLPGSPCPLCRFPTYSWAEAFEEEVIELIKRDFPNWQPQEGACERCSEVYSVRRLAPETTAAAH